MTAPPQRHGCRTGIALMASGRCPGEVSNSRPEVVSLTAGCSSGSAPQLSTSSGRHAGRTDRVVVVQRYVRAGDGAVRDIRLLQDGLVVPVVDQVLDRVGQSRLQPATLDDRDSIRCKAAGCATGLQLPSGHLRLVGSDRRVEKSDIGAARKK